MNDNEIANRLLQCGINNGINAYKLGKADEAEKQRSECADCVRQITASDEGRIRTKTIDEAIKTLAKSEDTILSDKQYYALMEMKGGAITSDI